MKSQDEIQTAHDLYSMLLNGEMPFKLVESDIMVATAAREVLCWILNHAEGEHFQSRLNIITDEMQRHGLMLIDRDTPAKPETVH